MASKDTGGYGGYFDGYIPATKEGLLKAMEELRKEIKQVKKISTKDKVFLSGQIRKVEKRITEIIRNRSGNLERDLSDAIIDIETMKQSLQNLGKRLIQLENIVQKDQDTFNKDIVDIKEKVDMALAAAEELQGDLKEVPAKRKPNPEGKEEKAEATALTLRLCKMNSSYHPAHPQVPKEAHTTVWACEQRLLL